MSAQVQRPCLGQALRDALDGQENTIRGAAVAVPVHAASQRISKEQPADKYVVLQAHDGDSQQPPAPRVLRLGLLHDLQEQFVCEAVK